ncbi:potassium voltage-gated channel protein Shal-like [Branchiostoma lanceolatum]|uniref:potassium voltage-gated channel protein Shal-like n=1 Tax=Branchiostoma lanceolatum TaxID=7740 RepID=UPI003454D93D
MAGLSFFEYPDIQDDEKGNRDTVLPEKQRLLQRRRSISTSLTKRLLSFSVHGGRVNSIRRVVFNVSGTRFVAWEDQLDRFPHTLLGSPSHRQVYYDADNKEYKFDRCPKVFKHILMYYRTGVLHLSDDVCLSTFREDLEFFRISLDESLGTEMFDQDFDYIGESDCDEDLREDPNTETRRLIRRKCSISHRQSVHAGGGPPCSVRRLVLNVSGTRFVVWEDQLDKFPRTLLGSAVHRRVFYNRKTDEYKFDRCPKVFKHILMYYNTGVLHFSNEVCLRTFIDDVDFFGICPDQSLCSCCYDRFVDEKHNLPCPVVDDDISSSNASLSQSPSSDRRKMWKVLRDLSSSVYGHAFSLVVGFFITVAVITNVIETVSCGSRHKVSCGEEYPWIFECIDTTCVIIFTIEFSLLFFSAPNKWDFFKNFMTLVDLMAILPFYLSLVTGKNDSITPLFRSFRGFRILRLGASTQRLKLLLLTLRECISQLMDILFAMLLFVIVGATLMFYVENSTNDGFSSIPDVFWYVIVTMMSVGYGDAVPHTTIGMVLGGLCSIFGVILVAIPLTIIGTTFSRVYKRSQVRQN